VIAGSLRIDAAPCDASSHRALTCPVLTVGVVPYLNAVPLVCELPRTVATDAGDPAALSARLEAGVVDAALLPVAEAIRGIGGGYLGSHGIACDGAVESVLAFLPVGSCASVPSTWPSTVVLDPASRTSVALLRVLLETRHGLSPRYRT